MQKKFKALFDFWNFPKQAIHPTFSNLPHTPLISLLNSAMIRLAYLNWVLLSMAPLKGCLCAPCPYPPSMGLDAQPLKKESLEDFEDYSEVLKKSLNSAQSFIPFNRQFGLVSECESSRLFPKEVKPIKGYYQLCKSMMEKAKSPRIYCLAEDMMKSHKFFGLFPMRLSTKQKVEDAAISDAIFALESNALPILERLWALATLGILQSRRPSLKMKPIITNMREGNICRGALELSFTIGEKKTCF